MSSERWTRILVGLHGANEMEELISAGLVERAHDNEGWVVYRRTDPKPAPQPRQANPYAPRQADIIAMLKDKLKPYIEGESDPALSDCIKSDLTEYADNPELLILALRIWTNILREMPREGRRWQQISNRGVDTPRSRYERNHVRIYAAMGGSK